MGSEPFSHTNSKGVKYYLNQKAVTLRGGKVQLIRYFTKDIRPEAMYELPEELAINENPRNGFLTVKLKEQYNGPSCEDDDDCECCEDCDDEVASVEQEAPKEISQYRKLFGRERPVCDGKCCAPVCRSDGKCCEETTDSVSESVDPGYVTNDIADAAVKAKLYAALKAAERKQVRPTIRRCLVEELKSFAQTDDGNAGEQNSVVVSYEYDDGKGLEASFTEVTPPNKANIREDSYGSFNGNYKTYSRLQLQAHIKNLQTILNTLV